MDFDTELKHFQKRLEDLSKQLQLMRKFGLNEELLIAYMCHKLKLSEKKARQIMVCYETFYDELLKGAIVKDLQNEKTK